MNILEFETGYIHRLNNYYLLLFHISFRSDCKFNPPKSELTAAF
jgi:hypothetical protein